METNKFTGIITALSTPFLNGEIDLNSFKKLVNFQREQGVDGFVLNGTTAESPCLSKKEVETLFYCIKKEIKNELLILGVGSNSTKKTLDNIKRANSLNGVDAILAVVPYYNKPPQRGLVSHFNTLADKSSLPVILYNVPARTGTGLSLESILKLSTHPNIIGIKEASGNIKFAQEILENTHKDFILFSGDDDTCFELFSLGAKGVISVVSHILGHKMKTLFKQLMNKNSKEPPHQVLEEYKKYQPLLKAIYSETNPIGIKKALALMNVFKSEELRSPLCTLNKNNSVLLEKEMKKIGLL